MLHLARLDGEYLKIRADREVLQDTVAALRDGIWDGLNVTMPLKADAAALTHSLSPMAMRAGAVNTLVVSDSLVHGDSTDSTAFHELLISDRFSDLGSILVLGAGGSAAAALAAMPQDRNVYVAARRSEQARGLTERLGGNPAPWGAGVAGALVINTTPIGMSGESLPDRVLEVASGLIDLPYAAEPTAAIAAAGAMGIPRADGHEFLMRQAIGSFALWTGVEIGFEELMNALRNA